MMNSNRHALALLAAGALLALSASCGADLSASADARAAAPSPQVEFDSNGSIGASGVSLSLQPSSKGSFMLEAGSLASTKAIYGKVRYDAAAQHFTGSSSQQDEGSLFIAVDDPSAGEIHFGWVLTNYDKKPGLSGDLTLAQFSFKEGPAAAERRVSVPPMGPDDTFALREDPDDPMDDGIPNLLWDDTLAGDGNNDGVVSVQDLTPIGLNYNANTSPNDKTSARDADYNKDGKVTVQDLANIGINFGARLAGYAVFSGPSATNLTELERLDRAAEFPAPTSADGILQWEYDGAEVSETTFFNVRPYDTQGTLGDFSTQVIEIGPGVPGQTPVDVVGITFDRLVPDPVTAGEYLVDGSSDTWLKQEDDFVIILTENAVDSTDGNAEDLDVIAELLQLRAQVSIQEDPGNPIDGTNLVQWVLIEGGGLADVGNGGSTAKGRTRFNDRGRVVIEAHLIGNFNANATISFRLFTIESLSLELEGGGTGPAAVNAGTDVDFSVTGLFDWDEVHNAGDELERDITSFVNWGMLPGSGNTGSFSLNSLLGLLSTDDASSGDEVQVVCEFPGTPEVTLHDNQRRSSDPVEVNIN